MSFRRLITVGVLAAGTAVLPALPGQAAPSTGSCDGSYPTNNPVITMSISSSHVTAGQSVFVFGNLHKNQCAIKGATIRIQAQRVVSGKATGSFRTVKSVTTARNGNYVASIAPLHNENLRARFIGGGGFPAVNSGSARETVRTRITEGVTKRHSCKVTFSGSTRPVARGETVRIQNRGPRGHFHGWKTIARATTTHTGHYSVTKRLTCGHAYNVSALIGATAVNAGGRSGTHYGVKPVH
ncbi:MAG TPA: hypothetical protein VFJ98_08260 [Mycobacteriales bacterium]|nr:hypothetical protein [Mycobacteriales bacterium]